MARYTLIFLIVSIIPIMGIAQNSTTTIEEAFRASKKLGKPLLVIRYDQGMIDYPKNYHEETDDSQLEALVIEPKNKKLLENDFIVFRLNSESSILEENKFQDQFILDYTPNLLLFSSQGEMVDFIRPSFYESDNKDLISSLKDTLTAKNADLITRISLEKKFNEKSITTPELLQFLKLKIKVRLKSRDAFNELAIRKGEISDTLMEAILSQEFKTTDPIVEYILSTRKAKDINWAYYKTMLVYRILEQAKINKDKEEFENASNLKKQYGMQLAEKTPEIYPGTPFFDEKNGKEYLNEQLLEEKFSFYSSISDTENVKKYGNSYATFVLNDYENKKKAIVDQEMAVSDYMANSFILGGDAKKDSLVAVIKESHEKNREALRKRIEKEIDGENADVLNRVAWAFYESISEKSELEKALGWAEKSIELKNNAAHSDTYAHLLFKLGELDKAINYESKAIELAKIEKNAKYVQEFEEELNRFKKSAKN